MNSIYYETLTPDNCILTLIDLQTGLLSNCRDLDPILLRNNIIGLCQMAKTANIPTVVSTIQSDGPNVL